MAQNRFEVPENKTYGCEFLGFSGGSSAGLRKACRIGSKWDVYWADSGLGGVEKAGVSLYNFDSRRTNLSIRYFNHLKSIRGRSPEAGLRRAFGLIFKVYPPSSERKSGHSPAERNGHQRDQYSHRRNQNKKRKCDADYRRERRRQ